VATLYFNLFYFYCYPDPISCPTGHLTCAEVPGSNCQMINAISKGVLQVQNLVYILSKMLTEKKKMAAIGCSSAVACCMNHDGIQFVSSGFLRY
jgi:hypothetical protein